MSFVQWVVTVFAAVPVPAKLRGTLCGLSPARFRALICDDAYGVLAP
jgi:hypothetical protein